MILAFESSCDESAIALFDPAGGLRGEWVHSQIQLHQEYGGVVPELASREHLSHFGPLLAGVSREVELSRVSQVAVTVGPGLAGCLAMGISAAKAFALAYSLPLVGINHLRGHAFSPFISLHEEAPADFAERLSSLLPHLGLIVSGGNTLLFSIGADRVIRVVAQTVDDAAGEALDKGAKLLGMPYPGGPLIEKKAIGGDARRFDFPRAMAGSKDMRFSFSGLKTALRYRLEDMDDEELEAQFPDLCASYQQAVLAQLVNKTSHALKAGRYKSVGLSGGVANNEGLRGAMRDLAKRSKLPLLVAEKRHTGDNAAMIAFAAFADPAGALRGDALSFAPSLTLEQPAK